MHLYKHLAYAAALLLFLLSHISLQLLIATPASAIPTAPAQLPKEHVLKKTRASASSRGSRTIEQRQKRLRQESKAAQENKSEQTDSIVTVMPFPSAQIRKSYLLALEILEKGDADRASKILLNIQESKPEWFDAYLTLSRCWFVLGKEAEALNVLDKCISRYPLAAEPYIYKADLYLSLSEFEKARTQLKIALQLEADDSRANFLRAQTELLLNEKGESVYFLRRALRSDPDSLKARVLLSRLLAEKNELNSAILEMNAALALDPDNKTLLCEAAALLAATGQSASALDKLQQAYKLDPESPEIQRALVQVYGERCDWSSAQEAASSWVQLDSKNPYAHFLLSWCSLKCADFDSAQRQIKAALLLKGDDPSILNLAGIIDMERKKNTEAFGHFQKAVDIEPDTLPFQLNLSLNYFLDDNKQKAVELLRKLALKYPEDSGLLSLFAFVEFGGGNQEKAAKLAGNALAAKSSETMALITKAMVLRELGNYKDSKKLLQTAVSVDAESSLALIELSRTFLAEGNERAAIKTAQRALQLAPGNLDAKELMGLALYEQKNYDGAIFFLKECSLRNAGRLNVHLWLAKAQMARGDFFMAESTLKKAKQFFPESADPLIGLAEFYLSQKEYRQAEASLRDAISLAPARISARKKLAGLLYLKGKAQAALDCLTALRQDELDAEDRLLQSRCFFQLRDFAGCSRSYGALDLSVLSVKDKCDYLLALLKTGQLQEGKKLLKILQTQYSTLSSSQKNELTKLERRLLN